MRKYVWETPEEINMEVAKRMKTLRKRVKLSRKKLSEACGVSYSSIKRFEETGNIKDGDCIRCRREHKKTVFRGALQIYTGGNK